MFRRIAIGATALAMTIGPAGSWVHSSTAATGDPFTCRASALRVDPSLPVPLDTLPTLEPIVANTGNKPCIDADAGVLNDQALPGGLGNASVLFAQTSNDAGSQAQAGVADVTITIPGAPVIRAEVLTSQANAECTSGSTAKPKLSSSSTVAKLTVGTTVIEPVKGPQTVPLGPLGNLFLNQQTFSPSSGSGENDTVTQRALFLDTPLADVVIAESIADFRGNPCDPGTPPPPPPGAPECSDGIDNDMDGTIDFPADSGCKSPQDDDEAAGFITGGGGYDEADGEDVVNPGDSLRFGAVLPCDLGDKPGPNLITTFLGNGNEGQFKLADLTRAYCRNNPTIDSRNPNAEFDTYEGAGTGTLRMAGQSVPARAEFTLVDSGEPGKGVDVYEIRVFVGPVEVASGKGTLDEGNIQAHSPGKPSGAGSTGGSSKRP